MCNELIYDSRLTCGSAAVARGRLSLPYAAALGLGLGGGAGAGDGHACRVPPWVCAALDPEQSVVFLDTDGLVPPAGVARMHLHQHQHQQCADGEEGRAWLESGGGDGNAGGSLVNTAEAELVALVVEGLRRGGFDVARGLGVLSPYRSQVSALKTALLAAAAAAAAARGGSAETETDTETERESEGAAMEAEAEALQTLPEISTVDKYQVHCVEGPVTCDVWRVTCDV